MSRAFHDPLLSTRLATGLATILLLASCGGGASDGPSGTGGPGVATSVKVTLSDSVVTAGTVVQATATVSDAAGRPVTNLGVRWSVSDSTVASVNNSGAVTTRRAGTFSVSAQAFDATGRVYATGSASARVRWAPGAWYVHDSIYVAFRGQFGMTINVPIAGSRVAVVFHGEENVYSGGVVTKPCLPVPPGSVIVGPGGTLVDNTARITETTQSTVMAGGLLPGDYNADGIPDILINGTACDVPQPTKAQRDYPKILLGDGNGGFTEGGLLIPLQMRGPLLRATTRPGGPQDLWMLSTRCYFVTSPADSVPVQYRGINWVPNCAAPGPFFLRNDGQEKYTYDNTSFPLEIARSLVGNNLGVVPSIRAADACDLNGDGWNDLVMTRARGDGSVGGVILNGRDGKFLGPLIPIPNFSGSGSFTEPMFCRDLDADGKPDVMMTRVDPTNDANYGLSATSWRVLHGNGDGTFTDVTTQALPGQPDVNSWANDVSFADINGDGRLDIVGKRGCASSVPVLPEPPLVWLGTTTPGAHRRATFNEVPTAVDNGGRVATAGGLWPVTAGGETMLLSVLTPYCGPSSLPPGKSLVRLFRRAP